MTYMIKLSLNIRITNNQDNSLVFEGEFDSFPITLGSQKNADIKVENTPLNHLLFSAQENDIYVLSLSSDQKILIENNEYTSLPLGDGKNFVVGFLNIETKVLVDDKTEISDFVSAQTRTFAPTVSRVQTVSDDRVQEIVEKNKGFQALKNFQKLQKVKKFLN